MLESSFTLRTVNMKLLLLLVNAICFAAVLAAPKEKREILPGDPRYGTDYHQQHHHHHHENEVELSRSSGGYVGSYTVPETDVQKSSFQVKQTNSYGPPSYQPSPPLNNAYLSPVVEAKQPTPVQSYGPPETHVQTTTVNTAYLQPTVVETKQVQLPVTSYGVPVTKVNVQETEETTELESTPDVAPVVTEVKTTEKVVEVPQVQTTFELPKQVAEKVNVVQTRVQETQTIGQPQLKVAEHVITPVQHDTTFNTFGNGFSGLSSDFSGLHQHQTFKQFPSSLPTTLYSGPHTTFGGQHDTGFLGGHQFGGSFGSQVPFGHQFEQYQLPKRVSYHQAPIYYRVSQPAPLHLEQHHQHTAPVHQYVDTPVVQEHSQKGVISDFFQNNFPNLQEQISNLNIPSFQPSIPFLKPTEAPQVSVPATLEAVNPPTVRQDSITIENPVHTVTETKHEYVQPTDENGGYIY